MSQAVASKKCVLTSGDRAMLDGLLKDWCDDRGHDVLNAEAQEAAQELTMWFKFGVDRPDQLRDLLASR